MPEKSLLGTFETENENSIAAPKFVAILEKKKTKPKAMMIRTEKEDLKLSNIAVLMKLTTLSH